MTQLFPPHSFSHSIAVCRMQWFLAVCRSFFHSSLLCTFSCHPSPPTILPSSLTSSCHLFLGLPLNLVVPKFIYNTLLWIRVLSWMINIHKILVWKHEGGRLLWRLSNGWSWCKLIRNSKYIVPLHYLLTPWCRVLLEKLTGLQLVKKFPAFHGTRRFITALTSVRHLSLSWASPIQFIYSHPTSWRSVLILSTHLV